MKVGSNTAESVHVGASDAETSHVAVRLDWSQFEGVLASLGPTSLWKANEVNGTVLYDTEGTHNGTLVQGGKVASENPAIQRALVFGDTLEDHSDFPIDPTFPQNVRQSYVWAMRGSNDNTLVDVWAYVPSPGFVSNSPALGDDVILFEVNGNSGSGETPDMAAFTFGQLLTTMVNGSVASPTVDWRDGAWHLWAISLDNDTDTFTMWIDGEAQSITYPITGNPALITTDGFPITYGPGASTDELYPSAMSHFTIYPRALTQGEVDDLWAAFPKPTASNLATVPIPDVLTADPAVGTIRWSETFTEGEAVLDTVTVARPGSVSAQARRTAITTLPNSLCGWVGIGGDWSGAFPAPNRIRLRAGRTYTFSVKVRSNVATTVRPRVWSSTDGGATAAVLLTGSDVALGANTWETRSLTFTTPGTEGSVNVFFDVRFNTVAAVTLADRCWVQDAVVVEGSSPGVYMDGDYPSSEWAVDDNRSQSHSY